MYEDKRRKQAKQEKTIVLEHHLYGFMGDMLWGLNKQIDRRLVSTFLGLVMAIIATTPILVIPIARVVEGEKITMKALVGALIAVAGATGLALAS